MTKERVCEILADVNEIMVTDDYFGMTTGLWYDNLNKPKMFLHDYEDIKGYIKVKDNQPVGATRVADVVNRGIEFNVRLDLEDKEGERKFDCLVIPEAKITDENKLAKILLKVKIRYLESGMPPFENAIYAKDLVAAIEEVEKFSKDLLGSAEDLHTESFKETETWKKVLEARKGKKK